MPRLISNKREQLLAAYCRGSKSLYFLGRKFGVSSTAIILLAKRRGVYKPRNRYFARKHATRHNAFTNLEQEAAAYWFGFLFADGCVHGNYVSMRLAARDRLHLHRFAKFVGAPGAVKAGRDKRRLDYSHFAVYSKQLVADLRRLGCVPRKTYLGKWPRIPPKSIRHFLRGLVDGDGGFSIRFKGNHRSIRMYLCGTKVVLETARKVFAKNYGAKLPVIRRNGKSRHCHIVMYAGNPQVRRIAEWLYADATVWLPRKKRKLAEASPNRLAA
jgi:hypothetical protein